MSEDPKLLEPLPKDARRFKAYTVIKNSEEECVGFKKRDELLEIRDISKSELKELIYLTSREVFYALAQRGTDSDAKATEIILNGLNCAFHIKTLRNDDKPEKWVYNAGIWKPNGNSVIDSFCRKVLKKAYKKSLVDTVKAKVQADTYTDEKILFEEENPDLICVNNGVLNLKTKELTNHSYKYKFFNKLPVNYDPDSKCPEIIKFFKSVLSNDEDIKILQELIGYCLYRKQPIQKAVMFCGVGRNGKSVTFNLIKHLLGSENCVNIPIQDFETNKYAMGELNKRLVNLGADISSNQLNTTNNFKSLSGEDSISPDRKFKSKIHFKPYCKHIFSANELPRTQDTSIAFFDRWILIDFPYIFHNEINFDKNNPNVKLRDNDIINKITEKTELQGLLNWCIEGLNRLLEKGSFSNCDNIKTIKNKWIAKSDSLRGFIEEYIEEDINSTLSKSEFSKAYNDYCLKHKIKRVNDRIIKSELENKFGSITSQKEILGIRNRVWTNIKFKVQTQATHLTQGFPISPIRVKSLNGVKLGVLRVLGVYKENKTTYNVYSDIEIIQFIKSKKGYSKQETCNKYNSEIIDRLLKQGYLVESPAGHLIAL